MPTFTKGDFVAMQVMAESMWANNREAAVDNNVDVETAKAILAEQTADLKLIEDTERDVDVRITWNTSCDDTVDECSGDDCEITPTNDTTTQCADLKITNCKSRSFGFLDKRFRNNMNGLKSLAAKEMNKAIGLLDEEIAKYAVAQLDSYAGVNAYLASFAQNGNVTEIPASQFSASTHAYFAKSAVLNRMKNSFYVDGGIMFQDMFLAQYNKANANGKTDDGIFKSMKYYGDLFNISSVIGKERMYMVDKGAVALANKHWYTETPVTHANGAGVTHYAVKSNTLVRKDGSPFMYDVIYMTECVGEDIKHLWKVKARYEMFLNPLGCDSDNTGVLAFECV